MMDWRSHDTASAELHEGRTLAMQIRKNLRLLEIFRTVANRYSSR
jgi:hypothetical protein